MDTGPPTHKCDGAIPGVEYHFLEALVLGKLVPEYHFHLQPKGQVEVPK